jgi:RPA family protein
MSEYNTREPAKRVFAAEFNDSTHTFKESDDERAPNYQLLRTGDKANRILFIGTVTETEDVGGNENEFWRMRVSGPTGVVYVTAGQYEPEAADVIRNVEPPEYVAVIAKPSAFEPEDSDDVLMSLRAKDSITIVDDINRQNWVADTAQQTLDRIENTNGEYVGMAEEIYATEREEFKETVREALEELQSDETPE